MSEMTVAEMEDLADMANDIFEEGIEVSLNPEDAVKMFAAVVAANVVTYSLIVGIKALKKKHDKKRKAKAKAKIKKI